MLLRSFAVISSANGSTTNVEASGQRMVPRIPCLFSESESVSLVTLFVLPEAEGTNKRSSEHEVEKKRPLRKLEKDKLHAVLRTFLESIQVCPSKSSCHGTYSGTTEIAM